MLIDKRLGLETLVKTDRETWTRARREEFYETLAREKGVTYLNYSDPENLEMILKQVPSMMTVEDNRVT